MNPMNSKALITGGAGFIGSNLADALVARGWGVTVLDNLSTGHLSNLARVKDKITFIEGDIRDSKAVKAAGKGCDVIFHQAAVVSVPQTVQMPVESAMVNDIGTLTVLEAARKNGSRRIVLASSCAVYGDEPTLPKTEAMPLKPMSPYAVQKMGGEYYARLYHELYGVETVCLRYFNVYGPRQDPSSPYSGVISIFLTRVAEKKQPVIYGDGDQSRDFIFVQDVVKANILAATTPGVSGSVFNIGTGHAVTVNHLWDSICRLENVQIDAIHQSPRPGDIRHSLANIASAKESLGFSPDYVFEDGLALTYGWYQKSAVS
ncbi:MAG: SDR family oxidoreductase [Desulfobacterales bacterium]|jgi:UDP-glucose 4-epimerase|nr:SDR family oxidoreductase [Desulfobacterales bacterium]